MFGRSDRDLERRPRSERVADVTIAVVSLAVAVVLIVCMS